MRTTGAIGVPVRRQLPVVTFMVAAGVMLVAAGVGVLWRELATEGGGAPKPVQIQATAAAAEDWGFVLRADTAQVLRHRPGLEPADFVRTHAFGWESATVGELLDSPALMKELRLQPQLSPIDLIRLEARGS